MSRQAGYSVDLASSFGPVLELWERLGAAGGVTPFQSSVWLAAWAETFGRDPDTTILAVTVRDAGGAPVLGLPLVRRRVGRLSCLEFADAGVTDYNAPIIGAGAPSTAADAKLVWRALRAALPPTDVVRFERMPLRVGSRANPLALLPLARPSTTAGLALSMPEGYRVWRQALPSHFRKELGRCDRLFDALPDAAFRRTAGADDAAYAALERLQKERIATLDLKYILDDTAPKAFYRRLADHGGTITAVTAEGTTVGVLFGLRQGDRYVMLRIATNEAYTRLSPGRLVITRAMEALHAEGVTTFDFALGDYAYKRRLGGEPVVLCDLVAAGSPSGLPAALRFRLAAYLRADPRRLATARRLRAIMRRERLPNVSAPD